MSRSRTFTTVTAVALVLGLGLGSSPAVAGSSSSPAPAQAQAQSQGRKPVANASKMDRATFEGLSDDDVVEVQGKPMTKREVNQRAKALREMKAADSNGKDDFENARAEHARKQKADLDAENAPVMEKMSELRKAGNTVPDARKAGSDPKEARKAGGDQQEYLSTPIDDSWASAIALTGTTAPATSTPQISGMLGQLKPGSAVILFGSSFGTLEGEVRMYGTFPNGYIKLAVDSWGNGGIGVFVPSNIIAVLDQQVTLKVVTKAGAGSNYKTAPFTAARELRKMKMSDFSTRQCRDAALSSDTCTTVGQGTCSSTVCGVHAVYTLGLAASTDRYATTLKNGWAYDRHGFEGGIYFSPGPQEWVNPILLIETYALGNDKPTLRTVSTGSTPSFEVGWNVPSLWADTYKLNVYVTGPAGTPHV